VKFAAYALLWLHVVALGGGLFGLLIAIPHPELWSHDPRAAAFFGWALARGGAAGIVTGALTMLVWGAAAIGAPRTLLFAALACGISAAAELCGTRTGWPFGGYEYLTFLGGKLAGRVPYTIPLSWFSMGFAAYVLASAIVARAPGRSWRAVLLGAWLLTSWDLVLDPAMAALPQIQFWRWHEHGPYFGMPLRNLAGWFATGLAFIGLSRLGWGADLQTRELNLTVPFTVYVANVVWSMVLAVSAGLWQAALAGVALSLIPVAFALRRRPVPVAPAG
jgi:putative membrane protein